VPLRYIPTTTSILSFIMKGFASALFILAAAKGALGQIGAPVSESEEFGILTIHS
jgi:hypothetical protein